MLVVSADYRQAMIGDLVQTAAGTWLERAPTHCPSGHRLGPNRSLVGHTACAATARAPDVDVPYLRWHIT
jgi:hypothetical protein